MKISAVTPDTVEYIEFEDDPYVYRRFSAGTWEYAMDGNYFPVPDKMQGGLEDAYRDQNKYKHIEYCLRFSTNSARIFTDESDMVRIQHLDSHGEWKDF